MTSLYLHGLSIHGPLFLANFITNASIAYPVLRRYDVDDGQPESPELWISPPFYRPDFERLKARMALAGTPLQPRAFEPKKMCQEQLEGLKSVKSAFDASSLPFLRPRQVISIPAPGLRLERD